MPFGLLIWYNNYILRLKDKALELLYLFYSPPHPKKKKKVSNHQDISIYMDLGGGGSSSSLRHSV
jgi:hypothetical protein